MNEQPVAALQPRPVEINSHQFYARGWFHGWSVDQGGQLCAVVESERGDVSTYGVSSSYSLKFLDAKKVPCD